MDYQINSRHLRYFLAVAEDLHFRKAAERLFISQPGLSRQIKEMEEGIGFKLFERTNKKVALTKAGTYLQQELNNYFNQLDQIVQHAKLLDSGLVGELKLGYVGSAMQQVIPRLLLAYRKERPNVHFNLKELDIQYQIDALQHNDLDVGFVRLNRAPKGLMMHPVLNEPFCLVLPENHRLNASTFKSIEQVKEESFILFNPQYSASYFEKVMQIFDDCNVTPRVSHNTIHSSSIYKLVEHRFGISIVPKSLRSDHIKGIKFIELTNIPQRTVLSAVWNINDKNPAKADFLKEVKKIKA